MSTKRLKNYLRTYRRQAGLTQDQMAYLLGGVDGSKVSRYERSLRAPLLQTALALQAATNVPVHELFAGLYQGIRRGVEVRRKKLARRITAEIDRKQENVTSRRHE